MFGEGIARGTVSLSKGDGVNGVQIDRRRRQQLNAGKPPSRGIENLKLARLQPGWQQRVQTCLMRWDGSMTGSFAGYMTDIITNATPRVFKKFNYRIIWADGKGASKALC